MGNKRSLEVLKNDIDAEALLGLSGKKGSVGGDIADFEAMVGGDKKSREEAMERFRMAKNLKDFCMVFVESNGDMDRVMAKLHPVLTRQMKEGDIEGYEAKKEEYLRRDDIRKEIVRVIRNFRITPSRLISMTEEIAMDERMGGSTRLRAMELLGKWIKAFPEDEGKGGKNVKIVNNTLNISQEQMTRMLERRVNGVISDYNE